ncbi:YgiT-type zinc finger protein [Candidatus Poribacteria bacterium]|nr:YgiT-type zinc finger protein [Candidatus Poribacteria bacterium]
MMRITICPPCGSAKIKRVQRDWTGEFKGQAYTVPDLEFYECANCGEEVYEPQAMRKIEAHSPAYAKTRKRKQVRVAVNK